MGTTDYWTYDSGQINPSVAYDMAVLGPPDQDLRGPMDSVGYRPARSYGEDLRLRMLEVATWRILEGGARVHGPNDEGIYLIEYKEPVGDYGKWVEVGSLSDDLVKTDAWEEVHNRLRSIGQSVCTRWADYFGPGPLCPFVQGRYY